MNNTYFFKGKLTIILISIILISCGGSDDPAPEPTPTPRTAEDVREDFRNFTFNVGVNDLTLESIVEGVFWKFRVIVPEGASSSNIMPLVMRLHGGARGNNPDAHKSTDCLVVPGFEDLDAYIISPNSNGLFWYDEPNLVQVLALLDLATENLHIDANKVVAMGYSDGGNGSWFFAQYYSNLFSAAIPLATSYSTENTSGISAIDTPLYVIHGSDDTLFPLDITQGFVDASIDVGSDIEFIIADGLGHLDVCDYVPYLKDAVEWLETEIWN